MKLLRGVHLLWGLASTQFRVGAELVGGIYGGAICTQHQQLAPQLRTVKTCAKIWCSRNLAEGQPRVAKKLTFQSVFDPQPPSRPTLKLMDLA